MENRTALLNKFALAAFFISVLSLVTVFFATKNMNAKEQHFAIVDMQRLIQEVGLQITKNPMMLMQVPMSQSPQIKMQAQKVKEKVDAFAVKNKIVIFSKGAVFGHQYKDMTDEILKTF